MDIAEDTFTSNYPQNRLQRAASTPEKSPARRVDAHARHAAQRPAEYDADAPSLGRHVERTAATRFHPGWA